MLALGEYAGDISPNEAMDLLKDNPEAVLVDVRTTAEWSFVGVPDLSSIGKEVVLLEWQSYPSMTPNPDFISMLKSELGQRGGSNDPPVLFLCRSGVRSRAAAKAAASLGLTQCLNVAGGFEGGSDSTHHRGALEGWKASGLPWSQS